LGSRIASHPRTAGGDIDFQVGNTGMAGRAFSAISRYLKITAVVKIDYCYWQACLKNTVGYALRTFSSGSGESHPNRYQTVKELVKSIIKSLIHHEDHEGHEEKIKLINNLKLRALRVLRG
jgi:hypothetical protein